MITGDENADVALMDLNMRRSLFQMIRDQYVAAQLRDTGSVSFVTPLFRKLMQAAGGHRLYPSWTL